MFLTDNSKIEYQPKLNEKYIYAFFTLYFKFWRYFLSKFRYIYTPDLFISFFFLAFMSAGIIHPLNGQSTKHDKSFLLMLPNLIVVIL